MIVVIIIGPHNQDTTVIIIRTLVIGAVPIAIAMAFAFPALVLVVTMAAPTVIIIVIAATVIIDDHAKRKPDMVAGQCRGESSRDKRCGGERKKGDLFHGLCFLNQRLTSRTPRITLFR